jgi:hypothetical protein
MIWLRSLLVGIVAAIVTAVITVIALPLFLVATVKWWADFGEGAGGIGAFSYGAELVLPPTIAFVLGFWWSLRRGRAKRTVTRA